MHRVRIALAYLFGLPLLLLATGSAGAALASHLGRNSLFWDILTHFAPIWLAGALAALLGGLLFRGRFRMIVVGLGVTGVMAAGALIAPEFLRRGGPRAGASAPGQVKVIQFNVWAHGKDVEPVVRWLAEQDPDIAILEETTPRIRSRLKAEGRWHMSCDRREVVVLSKAAPVDTSLAVPRGRSDGPICRAAFRDQRGQFSVLGVHYAWPTDHEDQQRHEARLAAALRAYPSDRNIVAGDLNSTPWSFARRRWDAEFELPRRTRALFTWPAQTGSTRFRFVGAFPFLPIDHVYAGTGWATVKVERGPRLGSDHFPVVVTLAPVARR